MKRTNIITFFIIFFLLITMIQGKNLQEYLLTEDPKIANYLIKDDDNFNTNSNVTLINYYQLIGNIKQIKRRLFYAEKEWLLKKLYLINDLNSKLINKKNNKSLYLFLKNQEIFYTSLYSQILGRGKVDKEYMDLINKNLKWDYKKLLNNFKIPNKKFNEKLNLKKIQIKNRVYKKRKIYKNGVITYSKMRVVLYLNKFYPAILNEDIDKLCLLIAKYQLLQEIVSEFIRYNYKNNIPKTPDEYKKFGEKIKNKKIRVLLKDNEPLDLEDFSDLKRQCKSCCMISY